MTSILTRLMATAIVLFAYTASAQTPPVDNDQPKLSRAELDQLAAPIALYPDPLLSTVLMAATYPLEVVEAARWVEQNKGLSPADLKAEADKQSWDDSVKELTATPTVLAMMNGEIAWTEKLGDAVLAQQPDVMDAVQRLRVRAEEQNKLQTTKEQKVTRRVENNRDIIMIEPAEPDVIYVPYYEPAVVYGAWPYPAYPPYYWPNYYYGPAVVAGIGFTAFAVGAWATHGRWWGGGIGWGGRNIYVRRNVTNIYVNNNRWRHNAAHRGNAAYKNRDVAGRYDRQRTNANRNNSNRVSNANRNNNQQNVTQRGGNASRQNANNNNRGGGKNATRPNTREKSQAQRPRNNSARTNRANAPRAQANRGGGRAANRGGGNGGKARARQR